MQRGKKDLLKMLPYQKFNKKVHRIYNNLFFSVKLAVICIKMYKPWPNKSTSDLTVTTETTVSEQGININW